MRNTKNIYLKGFELLFLVKLYISIWGNLYFINILLSNGPHSKICMTVYSNYKSYVIGKLAYVQNHW